MVDEPKVIKTESSQLHFYIKIFAFLISSHILLNMLIEGFQKLVSFEIKL